VIDIHTHILPKVDDGSPNLLESIKMLQQAAEDGIEAIVCTPHILKNSDFENEAMYIERFEELQKLAQHEKIAIELYLGSEIYIQPDISFTSRLATLNNTGRYFLVEFPMSSIPRFVAEMFFQLITDGKTPIIAHPERNLGFLQHPELAYEFVYRGALLQLNAGSLRGHFGPEVKTVAELLIDHNLVHFIASDCHNSQRRKCQLQKARFMVAERWNKTLARQLFLENPRHILEGNDFIASEPQPIVKPQNGPWKKFLNGFNKFWK